MYAINPLHDPLCPLNAGFNDSVGNRRAVGHPEEVIRFRTSNFFIANKTQRVFR